MNIRKKQSDYTIFGEVPGWRVPLKKYQDISSPLVINQVVTVRSFADINRSPRYNEHIEDDNKKLPDLKRKSKSLGEKKLKQKETENNGEKSTGSKKSDEDKCIKNSVSSHTKRNQEYRIKYNSVFDDEDKRTSKVKSKLNGSGKLKTVRGNTQKIKVVGEVSNFDKSKGIQFKGTDQDEFHSKRKNKVLSPFSDCQVDSEYIEKKLPILFSLETNSCFSKDLNLNSTKVLKGETQHHRAIESVKSQPLIPNFNLIVSKPDPIKLPSTKPFINLAEISDIHLKPSDLEQAKSYRSQSMSKYSHDKPLKDHKQKNPLTPSTNKSDGQKWPDIQLSTIKEETFSQLALKNRVSKLHNSESIPKNINGVKGNSKKLGLASPKQKNEKILGFGNFELAPFSRDESPEDLITQLRNSKMEKSAGLNENNLLSDCGVAQKDLGENLDKRKSMLRKKSKKNSGKCKLTEKILKQNINIEFPAINHIGTSTENRETNEFINSKKGTERFLENYSIFILSYLNLILVDFKGNLGIVHEKIEESHEQRKQNIENTEIVSLYKNRIKEKMIFELDIALEPFKKHLNLDTPNELAISITNRNFSEGIKNELISYITSKTYRKKFKSLEASLKKLVQNRLDPHLRLRFHSNESFSSDSFNENDFKQFSKSSKNFANKESLFNHIGHTLKAEILNSELDSISVNLKNDCEFDPNASNYKKNGKIIDEISNNQYGFTEPNQIENLNSAKIEFVDVENMKSVLKKQRFLKDSIQTELPDYQPPCPKLLILESESPNPSDSGYEQMKKAHKHSRRPNIYKQFQNLLLKEEKRNQFQINLK